MKQVLGLSAYRRLLTAYIFNELAWSIGSLALALLVYRRTGSAIGAMGFYLCSQFVPALLCPAVVARVDQLSSGRILPTLYALEGLLFLLLAWVAARFSVAPVLALALIDGVVALTARSLARTATVGVIAPAGLLREGNALTNGAFSICFMVGPAVGGLIVAAGGTTAALLTNSALFAVISVILVSARDLPAGSPHPAPSAGRLRAALAHVKRRPAVRTLLGLQAAALVFFTISVPVEVVFVQGSLHAGAGGLGALLSAWGAGAVAGSAIYARWRRLPGRTMIALGAAALGSGFLVMALAPSLVVAIIGAVAGGTGNGIEAIAAHTELQERAERRWLALTLSLNESVTQAVPGVGIAIGGILAALAGPRLALAVAAAGAWAVTVAARILLAPGTAGRGATPSRGREGEPSQRAGAERSASTAEASARR